MPIVWAQAPSSYADSTAGYDDILHYISRYGRLDTYDFHPVELRKRQLHHRSRATRRLARPACRRPAQQPEIVFSPPPSLDI